MKLFQNQLSFFIENILGHCIFKGALVYVQKQKISPFRPCILNKGATFSMKSMVLCMHVEYVSIMNNSQE
jgi:hypothetical protein